MQRRRATSEETRGHTDQKCKEQEALINGSRKTVSGDVLRQKRHERTDRYWRDRNADESARQREHNTIGQKLPANSAAQCADGESRTNLPLSGRPARQEKPGDVQARERQQHRGRREENPERPPQGPPQQRMTLRSRNHVQGGSEELTAPVRVNVGKAR